MNSQTTPRSSSPAAAPQPEPVAVPAAANASANAPLLVRPVEGRPAQGSYALFRWIDPAGGAQFQLQVAPSQAFGQPVIDVTVGATTEVTLMSMLPEDGKRYFWRVGRLAPSGEKVVEWSQPAAFTAATEEVVHTYDEARDEKRLQHAAEATVAVDPWQEGQTGGGWAAVVTFVMIVSFLLTVSVLFFAASRMGV